MQIDRLAPAAVVYATSHSAESDGMTDRMASLCMFNVKWSSWYVKGRRPRTSYILPSFGFNIKQNSYVPAYL